MGHPLNKGFYTIACPAVSKKAGLVSRFDHSGKAKQENGKNMSEIWLERQTDLGHTLRGGGIKEKKLSLCPWNT